MFTQQTKMFNKASLLIGANMNKYLGSLGNNRAIEKGERGKRRTWIMDHFLVFQVRFQGLIVPLFHSMQMPGAIS